MMSSTESGKITKCRSCSSTKLNLILDMGHMPLANSLLKHDQLQHSTAKYPLRLIFCEDCSLIQIDETVDPKIMFSDYLYFSSFSDTLVRYSKELAEKIITRNGLNKDSFVIEIAANDGYLLQFFVKHNIPVLGIEPAANVARKAEEKGITMLSDFFSAKLAQKLSSENKKADIVIANNVLAHVDDLNGFVEGIKTLLNKEGTAAIQVHYARSLIDNNEFDTIYHEHLCYYSITSLRNLFARHDLVITDAEITPLLGGSLQLFVGHKNNNNSESIGVKKLFDNEVECKINRVEYYRSFGERINRLKTTFISMLNQLMKEGKTIAGYGAAAKTTVMLNYFGITSNLIPYVVDRNSFKQGRYIPGAEIPVYSPAKLLDDMPDYTALFAWNYADEVMKQQSQYLDNGGHFIVPIPFPKIAG